MPRTATEPVEEDPWEVVQERLCEDDGKTAVRLLRKTAGAGRLPHAARPLAWRVFLGNVAAYDPPSTWAGAIGRKNRSGTKGEVPRRRPRRID